MIGGDWELEVLVCLLPHPSPPLHPADDMLVGIIWAVKPERHRTDESEIQLHDFSIQIQ